MFNFPELPINLFNDHTLIYVKFSTTSGDFVKFGTLSSLTLESVQTNVEDTSLISN